MPAVPTDSAPSRSLDLIGLHLLDRYLLEERVARGGMSIVYRALDERLQRPVCVKVFCDLDPLRTGYRTIYDHFVQEAFAVSQLSHPNTIRMYDFGYLELEPFSPFQVAEFLDGGTLRGHVRNRGRLENDEVLAILEPVVGALSEAHSQGIIHRDIKPSNILFGRVGTAEVVKLCDFSIAKAQQQVPNRAPDTNISTPDKVAMYSLPWAAPEQLCSAPVNASTDVYSLGLITAFMCSGVQIFKGKDVAKVLELRRRGDSYVDKSLARMKIEAPVAEVIRRACRTSSKARYQTADEFLAALRHAFDDPEWEVTTRTASPVSGDPSSSQSDGAVEWTQTGGPTRSRKSTGKPTRSSPPSRSGSPRLRGPRLPVDPLADEGEVLVGGRRLRLLEVDDDLVVGDFESCPISTPARIRISFPPFADHSPQLHIKGLNAFIVKDGGRPSGGVNITSDADLALISPARDPIDFVRFSFGILEGTTRLLEFAEVILEVQLLQIAWVVAVDFGPGRDAALLYHRRK